MRTFFYVAQSMSLPTLALVAACGGEVANPGDAVDNTEIAASSVGRNHLLRMNAPDAESGIINKAAKTLTYYGGPNLTHFNRLPHYLNSGVPDQGNPKNLYR